jgi:hypothetical protein
VAFVTGLGSQGQLSGVRAGFVFDAVLAGLAVVVAIALVRPRDRARSRGRGRVSAP